MIKSMFNVLKLIIDELPYEQCSITHDLGHKKEVYVSSTICIATSARSDRFASMPTN